MTNGRKVSCPQLQSPAPVPGGDEVYPTIESKATALCFSLVMNHPFVDGNKRIGHASMETFLVMTGYDLVAEIDDSEKVILSIAAADLSRGSNELHPTSIACQPRESAMLIRDRLTFWQRRLA